MKIKDVISLEKDFHPVFDFKAETSTSGYWRRFITNEQFIEILDTVLTAISSKEDKLRKSIWIQGSYGTGKSHSAAVIKHLLWDNITDQDVSDYIKREIKNPDVSSKLRNLRKSSRFLPVVIKGAEAASDHNTMVFTIQKAVRKALKDYGFNVTVKTDFQNFIYQVEEGLLDFDKCIRENDELSIYVKNKADILKRLKSEDVDFLGKLTKVLSNKRTFFSAVNIEAWLSDIVDSLKSKDIADGIIIYWDEFTSILDKSDSAIINQVQGIAELSKVKNVFLYLISHRMPSAIDSSVGSDDIKKIEDRFYRLQYNMEPTTTYHILTRAIKKTDEAAFNKIKDKAYDGNMIELARTLSGNSESTFLEDLKSLFPFHPYAAYLLTFIARNLGSTNRSIFDFLYDEKLGFSAFGGNEFTSTNMITADYLWDFFIGIFELNPKFSIIVSKYKQYEKPVKRDDDFTLRIFKSILMLNALNSIISGISDSNNPLNPSVENICNTFMGIGVTKKRIEDSLNFLSKNRIIEKNPFDEYVIEVSSLPSKEIEKEKQKLKNEYDGDPLAILRYQSMIGLEKIEEIADETLRLTDIKFFKREADHILQSKIISQLKNEMSINIAMFFMINGHEKPHLSRTLTSLSNVEEIKNKLLIFSDEPFGDSNYDKFLDYLAKYNLCTQQGDEQATSHKNNISELIRDWVRRIKASRVVVFFRGNSLEFPFSDICKIINTRYAPKIFNKGLDILNSLRMNKNAWAARNTKVVAERVLVADTRETLERSLTGQYAAVLPLFKDSDDSYIIDRTMSLKIGPDEQHPIAILQKVVDDKLIALKNEPSFNLLDALTAIFKRPFGYYASIFGYAAVAYVMRKYVNELYSTTTQRKIDASAMKELLAGLLDGITYDNVKNRNIFNVRFGSKEEMELKSQFLELFNISDSENINDTRWLIRDYCKKDFVNAPIWSLKYLDGISDKEKSALNDIEKFVRDASEEIDLKRIRDMLDTVKSFKFELKTRIVPENFKIGLDNFIFTELSSANIASENIATIRDYIQGVMQAEVGLWEEAEVKNAILNWALKQHRQSQQSPDIPNATPVDGITDVSSPDTVKIAEQSIKEFSGDIDDLKSILLAMLRDSPSLSLFINKYFH